MDRSAQQPPRSAKVLATGIITVDQIFGVDALPEADGKYLASTFTEIGGGVAANAAVAVVRLGGTSLLAGCVGDDVAGDRATSELDRLGIDVTRVQKIEGATTPISTAIVDHAGGRMVVNHVSPNLYRDADSGRAGVIDDADAVLVDCRWPAGAIETLRAARTAGIPAIVDVDRPLTDEAEPILELGSHLVFSREALCATAQINQPVLALRALRSRTSAWVAVTEGAGGVTWLDDEGLRHRDAFQVDVVDTLGAGDVFHGAFGLALAEGRDEEAAITCGAAAPALKCARPGGRAGIPARSAVELLLAATEGALC
jgi:sulfofructose kinase